VDRNELRASKIHFLQVPRTEPPLAQEEEQPVARDNFSRRRVVIRNRRERLEVPLCRCKGRCFRLFSVAEMVAVRMKLKEMSYGEKQLYITSLVDVRRAQRPRNRPRQNNQGRRRRFSVVYHLRAGQRGNLEVCKEFFKKFMQIGGSIISKLTQQIGTEGVPVTVDGRGRHGKHKTMDEETQQEVENFIRVLPKFKVKYKIGSDRGKEYLSASWTVRKLVAKFNAIREQRGKEPVSRKFFKGMMSSRFPSLSIGVPKTDCCTKCLTLDDKAKTSQTEEEKLSVERQKEEHLEIAQDRRDQYNMDVKKAKGTYVEEVANVTVNEEYVDVGSEDEGKIFCNRRSL
jgi:hypothetical protein